MIAGWFSAISFSTVAFHSAFALAHAHGDRVVELDAGLRAKRNHDELDIAHALREIAGDRAPDDRRVDLSLRELGVDDLPGILFGVR